jgi:hypothetical protein
MTDRDRALLVEFGEWIKGQPWIRMPAEFTAERLVSSFLASQAPADPEYRIPALPVDAAADAKVSRYAASRRGPESDTVSVIPAPDSRTLIYAEPCDPRIYPESPTDDAPPTLDPECQRATEQCEIGCPECPAPPPERFWRVGWYDAGTDRMVAVECSQDGAWLGTISRKPTFVRAFAEADGRASGLPEWQKKVTP